MKATLIPLLVAMAAACSQVASPTSPTAFEVGPSAVLEHQGSQGGKPLEAVLLPLNDPDGSGSLEILANAGRGEMCYVLRTYQVAAPTAVHVHQQSGGVEVFTLDLPYGGYSHDCVYNLDTALVREIARNPETFYVVVHTVEFPNGAIHGTLVSRDGKPRW